VGNELLLGPDYSGKLRVFSRITPGMTQQEVVGILGEPSSRDTTFHLAQREHFEEEYRRARVSGSREWWFWSTGDYVMAVGFDKNARVTMTSKGGT
jgi:hypothetical protein